MEQIALDGSARDVLVGRNEPPQRTAADVAAVPFIARRMTNRGHRFDACVEAGVRALDRQRIDCAAELQAFVDLWRRMDEVAPLVMAQSLWDLGWLRNAGESMTVEEVVRRCNARARYASLMSQWLNVLVHHGFLLPLGTNGRIYSSKQLDEHTARRLVHHAIRQMNVPAAYPGFFEFFDACVRSQVALLTGAASPHKLLFPMGSSRVVDGIYRDNPVASMQNRVAAAVVAALCRLRPTTELVRVLEVGAGTGATTSAVLAQLTAGSAEYCFTDVSRFFIKRASRQFERHFVPIEYQLLDIDREPAEQGFEHRSFDIVIGANVLHTARHVDAALKHLRNVLRDDGFLVAIETTSNTALQMITFGHFDGVNHFEDRRRHSNLPFLSEPEWRSAIVEAGFARVEAIPRSPVTTHGWCQHVLVAATESE